MALQVERSITELTSTTVSYTDLSLTDTENIISPSSIKQSSISNYHSSQEFGQLHQCSGFVSFLCFADDIVTESSFPSSPSLTFVSNSNTMSHEKLYRNGKELLQDRQDIPKELSWVNTTYNQTQDRIVADMCEQLSLVKSRQSKRKSKCFDDTLTPDELSSDASSTVKSVLSICSRPTHASSKSSDSLSLSTLLESEDTSESSFFTSSTKHFNDYSENDSSTLINLKLRNYFKMRQNDIRRLSKGNKAYRNYLSLQEELVERQEKNKHCTKFNHYASKDHMQGNLRQKIKHLLQFERFHTLPGVTTLIAYAVAHCSCYEFFYYCHLLITLSVQNRHALYAATFFIGVLLTRISGSVWNWLSCDRYEGAKFDMHNKIRLGHKDAKILRWIRKRKYIRIFLDVAGVYLIFIAITYVLNDILLYAICDVKEDIRPNLPSYKSGIDAWAYTALGGSDAVRSTSNEYTSDIFGSKSDQCFADSSFQYQEVKSAAEEADAEYLYESLSLLSYFSLFGWENPPIVTQQCHLLFTLFNSLFSVSYLFYVGVGFWDD